MSKFFRGLLSVSLCFCLICSICGVSFAAEDGGGLSLPSDVGGGSTDVTVPDAGGGSTDVTVPDAGGGSTDVTVPDAGGGSTDVTVPDAGGGSTDVTVPDAGGGSTDVTVPDAGGDTTDVTAPDAGGDASDGGESPSVPPDGDGGDSDTGGDTTPANPSGADSGTSGGSGGALALPPGDVTYITLPEDYVIKSSTLEGTYAIDPQSALAPVTSSNTSGLKSVLLSILGSYDPIVAEYQYLGSGSSYYNYIREIQPDYVWLSSAAIFAILLYCTWRLLGGLICRQ